MKYLKTYEELIWPWNKKDRKIHKICKLYNIQNYTINSDGSIDVNGDVDFNKRLTKLPLNFRNVSGYFYCSNNQLTSLEGSPQQVGGDFYCSRNQLTSLQGCPQHVGGYFYCSRNQLTSLPRLSSTGWWLF